jgi:hypothetical protein
MRAILGRGMCMNKRLIAIVMCAASLPLVGCATSDGPIDDSTLFSGHQSWEDKRHADDWVMPLGDDLFFLALASLDSSGNDCQPIFAPQGDHHDDKPWSPATVIKTPPAAQKPPISHAGEATGS